MFLRDPSAPFLGEWWNPDCCIDLCPLKDQSKASHDAWTLLTAQSRNLCVLHLAAAEQTLWSHTPFHTAGKWGALTTERLPGTDPTCLTEEKAQTRNTTRRAQPNVGTCSVFIHSCFPKLVLSHRAKPCSWCRWNRLARGHYTNVRVG